MRIKHQDVRKTREDSVVVFVSPEGSEPAGARQVARNCLHIYDIYAAVGVGELLTVR